ncbi:phosphoglycerate kinase [Psychrobacter sp. FDAARGOS_221]|uniref:phosphoglycerate kinase n=1 Tax=Psychrobacter sp. FDAARGOS_221 TaxID=1975705 RepID=UPI000BB59AD0|nr:phosphoglycerate kinase [Psychrobacter sp. FDAARGOS_221]PNK59745.1 phosphoglycerate kinase [Psychrobacter sp. FDAARGOS_221]
MNFARMENQALSGKRVLIREDLNVPIQNGKISNDARLKSSIPTIKLALEEGAAVLVCSHLGRPSEGEYEEKYSLQPVAKYLSEHLGQTVKLQKDYVGNNVDVAPGEVVLLENVRFNQGEKKNSPELSADYANLCDVFVMDAFGTAHRAQASTEGVIQAAASAGKVVCAGPLLAAELDALDKALHQPKKPLVAIVGGSKVSTKLDVLISLAKICDQIIVGGGIANTFIAAKGHSVGASLYEADMIDTAKDIMAQTEILLPENVVVADKSEINFDDFINSLQSATPIHRSISEVGDDEMILDVAKEGSEHIFEAVKNAATILWNGPVGVFEVEAFAEGTRLLSQAVSDSNGFSIAGGGDTLAAIHQFEVEDGVSYMSTGGGAFLEFVEGKTLPAVAALQNHSNR